jgi:AcrR family transcriptional regulator
MEHMAKKSDRIGDRRHKQGIESRRRILEVAFEIAAERGYDGTTLSEVTKRAGVPPSSVYWQFENKDELLAEVVEVYYREWREGQASWLLETPTRTAEEDVDLAVLRLTDGLINQPDFQRLGLILSLEQRVEELSARKRFRQIRIETRDLLTHWWEHVLPELPGEERKAWAKDIAVTTIAMSDGLLVATQIDEDIDVDGPIRIMTAGLKAVISSLSTSGNLA